MIRSRSNRAIKEVIQLQKKSKVRNASELFVVEGLRLVAEIPPAQIKKIYVSEKCYKQHKNQIVTYSYPCEMVSDEVFSYMSDTKSPQGILGIVRQRRYGLPELLREEKTLLLLLETLQDPGNLGTIFRTAEAAGVTGIIMDGDCVDMYHPKVIRSTMGTIFRMPFVVVEDLLLCLEELKEKKIRVYGTDLMGKVDYCAERYQGGLAFLVGNEGNGLSQALLEKSDVCLKIPMSGQVESLNAAVATAVLLYEVRRQRGL
ncbi:MAG: RNA methyltransferase [Lachnospiraceae bacterium]|nr:RNA methyltransferase [Lachnospiraceae bacterium]